MGAYHVMLRSRRASMNERAMNGLLSLPERIVFIPFRTRIRGMKGNGALTHPLVTPCIDVRGPMHDLHAETAPYLRQRLLCLFIRIHDHTSTEYTAGCTDFCTLQMLKRLYPRRLSCSQSLRSRRRVRVAASAPRQTTQRAPFPP